MSKVIFVVDLGHFKAYRVTKDPFEKSPKTELIESYDSLEARLKLSDKLSDAAGRYRQAGGRNGKGAGFGEAHNIALESDKRIIKQIAADISEIVSREKCEKWCLAAPKGINNQILEHLEQHLRAKLDKNIPSNLTKTGKTELLAYFG
ncbi:MAG: host attachment protein, partial [Nitrospirota bacterium]